VSGLIFDASVFIAAHRLRQPTLLEPHRYGSGPLYLSSVVAQELYVGSVERAMRRDTDRLWHRFRRLDRLLVPTADDWREAGLLLGQIGEQLGYSRVGQGRLTNDALLAISARRQGITVLTANARDFALLARFRPLRFVSVTP
jgi:predicted nucleic acid-binding protein